MRAFFRWPVFFRNFVVPRLAAPDDDYIDYHVVVDPRPDGPVIGSYAGAPIAARVVDLFGRGFVYDGVAPKRRDGRYDPAGLRPGQWIAEPGLLYRLDEAQQEPDHRRSKP
jgi:hypothetical protein